MARNVQKILREWLFPAWPSIIMLLVFVVYWGFLRSPSPNTSDDLELLPAVAEEQETGEVPLEASASESEATPSELERFQAEEKKVQVATPAMPLQELRSLVLSPTEKSTLESIESRFSDVNDSSAANTSLVAEIDGSTEKSLQAIGRAEISLAAGKEPLVFFYEVFRKPSEDGEDSAAQPVCWRMTGKSSNRSLQVFSEMSCQGEFRVRENRMYIVGEAGEFNAIAVEIPFQKLKETGIDALNTDGSSWISSRIFWEFFDQATFRKKVATL